MTKILLSRTLLGEITDQVRELFLYMRDEEGKEAVGELRNRLESLHHHVFPLDGAEPMLEDTFEMSVDELVRMQGELASASLMKGRVAKALINLYTLTTDTVDAADTPIISEGVLYEIIGKDDARSLLHAVEKVSEAAGLDPWLEVQVPAFSALRRARLSSVELKLENETLGKRLKQAVKDFVTEHPEIFTDGIQVPRIRFAALPGEDGSPIVWDHTHIYITNMIDPVRGFVDQMMERNEVYDQSVYIERSVRYEFP